MTVQSEQTLENNLIAQLVGMEYERVTIADEPALVANLKIQLEAQNGFKFSDNEFKKILNHLAKGSVYDRAKTLRGTMHLVCDNGESTYVTFLNQDKWCQNLFQVTNQVTMEGSYKNRYDVTILINGLPLVQVELKRRGLELKEAFNQTNRYQRHSYDASYGLFQYIQLFVISNGVNTKYYANNRKTAFKFTSFWADEQNNKITALDEFAKVFLEKCHIAKMISCYTVLNTAKEIMVFRPYQYYAVEAIIDRVKNSTKNGYIWHTTGSGKTLTSFKAAQILTELPEIEKVVFVVDRNDLDTQTIKEFNSFKEKSVDTTTNTGELVRRFGDETQLIVTTIQKLNAAISRDRHLIKMDQLKDKRIVFIFDECHRSQFGETHKRITEYFTNHQLFGFTGTPIFAENASGNALGKRTTAQLFDECLHKYVITDAIGDENVLKFAVEYYKGIKFKDGRSDMDIDIEAIDTQEAFAMPKRLEGITDFIIANHDRKTHSRDFTAMFCVSSVDALTKYYELLKFKRMAGQHNLKVATIFSYSANEDDKDANGLLDEDVNIGDGGTVNLHTRDKLESYIAHYNELFGTSFTTKNSESFYNYYRDIATRVKRREIDVLLVVNMFLTGFDSKTLNTLYVDKNLRYHGLLQAYSRTNRILDQVKSQGNIVVFRNLKRATDDAIALFSKKDAKEVIFVAPYEEYVAKFNDAVINLYQLTPTPQSVDGLVGEEAEAEFVAHFREVMRLRNVLISFVEFNFDDTSITPQKFEDYKSKYLDIHAKVQAEHAKEAVSILDDIDFELELIRRDDINVSYILRLLARVVEEKDETQKDALISTIMTTISGDAALRSKRELIEKFIQRNIPVITDADAVEGEFDAYVSEEKARAFEQMCKEEGLLSDKLQGLIDHYLFTGRKPRREELVETLAEKPRILERDTIVTRIAKKFNSFIEQFIEGL